jgi:hypothetical protein
MSASQRVNRGFHRLGFFLAATSFLVGGTFAVLAGLTSANKGSARHQELVCAHARIAKEKSENFFDKVDRISLRKIGCSKRFGTISVQEARSNPPKFNWLATFASATTQVMLSTLALSLAVYGLTRAIGWVVGGFAVSQAG